MAKGALMAALLPLLLTGCFPRFFPGVDIEDGQGARVSIRGDWGAITSSTRAESGGGPTSMLAGGSRGELDTTASESDQPPSLSVGGITMTGPFQTSPVVAQRVHGLGIVSRAVAQVKMWKTAFDFMGRREEARAATERAREASQAATERARIEATTEAARIRAAAESAAP